MVEGTLNRFVSKKVESICCSNLNHHAWIGFHYAEDENMFIWLNEKSLDNNNSNWKESLFYHMFFILKLNYLHGCTGN